MSDRYQNSKNFSASSSESFFQSALLEDVARYRGLLELTEDWFWEVDENLKYTYSSPQVFNILGYRPEEVLGRHPYSFMTNEEAHRVGSICKPLIKRREKIYLPEFVNIHKTGQKVYLESNSSPVFDDEKRFRGYRGYDRNITKNIIMEEELVSFDLVLSQMNDAAVILNKDLHITYLNQTFYDLFGYSPGDILNKPISKLSPPEEDDAVKPEEVIRALDIDGHWEGETKRRKKNGKYIPVYLQAKVIKSREGEVTGYLATYFNLTQVKKSEKDIRKSLLGTIKAISSTVEKRDPYTYGHQNRVTALAVAIARDMGCSKDFVRGLQMGSMIHDIGKIYIPAEILNRPGKISKYELQMIKTHSEVGFDIVRDIDFPWPVAEMVLQHHERLDGSGYPNNLTENEILQEAKIISVADVFEAMTSHRPYRPALEKQVGLQELETHKGTLYDNQVVESCVDLVRNQSFSFA